MVAVSPGPRAGPAVLSVEGPPVAPILAVLLALPLTLALVGVSAALSANGAEEPGLHRAHTAGPLTTVRGITVDTGMAPALEALLAAAEAEGVVLTGTGHRDTARQVDLRRAHCGATDYAIHHAPASACSPPTARPGTSMHERGLAVDFAHCGRGSPCFQWLSIHASAYGLHNLPSEPWHWSTNGR